MCFLPPDVFGVCWLEQRRSEEYSRLGAQLSVSSWEDVSLSEPQPSPASWVGETVSGTAQETGVTRQHGAVESPPLSPGLDGSEGACNSVAYSRCSTLFPTQRATQSCEILVIATSFHPIKMKLRQHRVPGRADGQMILLLFLLILQPGDWLFVNTHS